MGAKLIEAYERFPNFGFFIENLKIISAYFDYRNWKINRLLFKNLCFNESILHAYIIQSMQNSIRR